MAETRQPGTRRMALTETVDIASGAVVIQPSPPSARFSLRLDPALVATVGPIAGLTLDMAINRRTTAGGRAALRLGPDEWLLCGPEGEASQIRLDVEKAVAGMHHSLVDISHHHVAFAVSGRRAADALNSGCPLDLSPAAFPTGRATRTLLGKAEVILARTDDHPTFEIECARSFAAYVGDFLLEAAREHRAPP
jgi:sarcosine oxidase, subunit gamma